MVRSRLIHLIGAVTLLLTLISPLAATNAGAQETTGGLAIALVDDTGAALGGGCFDVTDASGATQAACDDDADGIATVATLPVGEVSIVQTSGPDGYALSAATTGTIEAEIEARVELTAAAIPAETPTETPETPVSTEAPTEVATATIEASTPEPVEPSPTPEASAEPTEAALGASDFAPAAERQQLSIQLTMWWMSIWNGVRTPLATGGSIALGQYVAVDTTLVFGSPAPTGQITFKFYKNSTCAGPPITEFATVGNQGDVSSFVYQAVANGVYSVIVEYGGDGNYYRASTICGDATVSVGLPPGPIHQLGLFDGQTGQGYGLGAQIEIGTRLTFKDLLTGVLPTGGQTGGDVWFRLYDNASCSGNMPLGGSSPASAPGPTLMATAESGIFDVQQLGNYWIRAYYYDALNVNAASLSACTSAFTIVKRNPHLDVSLSPTAISTSDSASASTTMTNYFEATGQIVYHVYTSSTCQGSPMAIIGPFDIQEPSLLPTSGDKAFPNPGNYGWMAIYSGDALNTTTTSNCAILQVLDPNLTVTKTASSSAINYPDSFGYTITISNAAGAGTARNGLLTDSLPYGYRWSVNAASTLQGCGFADGSLELSCPRFDLAPGASVSVTLDGQFDDPGCGDLGNQATYTPANFAPVKSSVVSVHVRCADLELLMTPSAVEVSPGGTLQILLDVVNSGEITLQNITVTENLGASLAGTTWAINFAESPPGCAITNGSLTCTFSSLAVGIPKRISVYAQVPPAACGDHLFQAEATATNEPSFNLSNNSPSRTVKVVCPDVAISKTPVNAKVPAGGTFGFVMTVSNLGSTDVELTALNDTLPLGYAWQFDNSDCEINAGVLSCDFGEIVGGGSRSVTITASSSPTFCGTVTNTATTSAKDEDPAKLANNSATASVKLTCPDLQVTNVAAAPTASSGGQVTFTVTVTNIGDGDATGVKLMYSLPYGVDWVGQTAGCAIYPGAAGCDFGTLAGGESRTLTLTGRAPSGMCGTLGTFAFAWSDNEQPALILNNMADRSVIVTC